jgi:hypothetical protein
MAGCRPPPQYEHLKWHVLVQRHLDARFYERARWVPDNGSGNPIWVRWGYCGDFAALCGCTYVGPAVDQESPYVMPADRGMEEIEHG